MGTWISLPARANRSSIFVQSLDAGGGERRLFTGPGRFTRLVWSPDGRWLLVAWPDANQLFFVRTKGPHKVRAVADVRRQFGGYPDLRAADLGEGQPALLVFYLFDWSST